MKYKFKVDDLVFVRFPSAGNVRGRTLAQMRVIKQLNIENKPFYKLDWTMAGRSELLNTVSVCENVLYETDN